jgi:hypothetical protein
MVVGFFVLVGDTAALARQAVCVILGRNAAGVWGACAGPFPNREPVPTRQRSAKLRSSLVPQGIGFDVEGCHPRACSRAAWRV